MYKLKLKKKLDYIYNLLLKQNLKYALFKLKSSSTNYIKYYLPVNKRISAMEFIIG